VTKPISSQVQQQVAAGEERRRSHRVMIRVPVTMQLVMSGHKITIQATTVSVNDHGAMLLCSRSIAANTSLEVQNDRTREKQMCRVVRMPVESNQGYMIPVEFIASATHFWGITFPPSNWKASED